jgi:hypothetical protein
MIMPREKLNRGNLKKHAKDLQQDPQKKREAAAELRRDFRGYVERVFELTNAQKEELDRGPAEFHKIAGEASAVAVEKGWEVDLVPHTGAPNMTITVYCKIAECGIRFEGVC